MYWNGTLFRYVHTYIASRHNFKWVRSMWFNSLMREKEYSEIPKYWIFLNINLQIHIMQFWTTIQYFQLRAACYVLQNCKYWVIVKTRKRQLLRVTWFAAWVNIIYYQISRPVLNGSINILQNVALGKTCKAFLLFEWQNDWLFGGMWGCCLVF